MPHHPDGFELTVESDSFKTGNENWVCLSFLLFFIG